MDYFCTDHEVYGRGDECWLWQAPGRDCLLIPGRVWPTRLELHQMGEYQPLTIQEIISEEEPCRKST